MPSSLRESARQRVYKGEYDIALEYNREARYWYALVPKIPEIALIKDEDLGECLHKLAWEIEAHMENQ